MRSLWLLFAALGALAGAGCQATPDLSFVDDGGGGAGGGGDATLPDGAPAIGGDSASSGGDGGGSGNDGATSDAFPDGNTCGLPSNAPANASCCGAQKCVGKGCTNCGDCLSQQCQPDEWCCVKGPGGSGGSGGGGVQCQSNPDPGHCS
jgi:hypothetical protein